MGAMCCAQRTCAGMLQTVEMVVRDNDLALARAAMVLSVVLPPVHVIMERTHFCPPALYFSGMAAAPVALAMAVVVLAKGRQVSGRARTVAWCAVFVSTAMVLTETLDLWLFSRSFLGGMHPR